MNRPVFWLVTAFSLGIAGGRFLSIEVWLGLVIIFLVYCGWMMQKIYIKKQTGRQAGLFVPPLILAGMVFLGAFWFHLDRINVSIDANFCNENVEGEGVIVSYPKNGATRTTFTVKLVRPVAGDRALPKVEKVLLQVDNGARENADLYLPGSKIIFRGTIRETGKARNPGETDYGEYLRNMGVSGIIECQRENLQVKNSDFNLQNFAARGRIKIARTLNEILPPMESSLLLGVLFGDVDEIPPDVWESFRKAGALHLFAVSGYNVGFVLGAVWFFLGFLRPKPVVRLIIAVPLLFSYYLLVGWTSSIVRASVMAFLALLALFVRTKNDIYTALALAAFFILLVNPAELFLVSFQLSFLATLGILYFTPFFEARGIPRVLSATLAAQLATTPLSAYYFSQISILAPLVNILAALMCGVITVLAFLGSLLCWILPILAEPFFLAAGFLIYILSSIVAWTSNWSWASLAVANPHPLLILAAYLIMAAWPWKARVKLAVTSFFPWAIPVSLLLLAGVTLWGFTPASRLDVVFLDVGQGDGIFIKTPGGRTVLVDGGGSPGSDYEVGNKIIRPYLQRQGLNKVDILVLTHNHLDHGEGIIELLESSGAGLLLRPAPERGNEVDEAITRLCAEKRVKWIEAVAGQRLLFDNGIFLEVLHPDPGDQALGNNHSVVLRLQYGKTRWLLTGDAENLALDELLNHCGDLRADILKLPHHGSKTSFNPAFYQAVSPRTAVVSTGRYSPNQPVWEIREYFSARHVPILITREKGAILTESDGKELAIRTFIP